MSTTTTTIVRPPFLPTTEHLFTPLVWVKPDGDKWTVEVDWAECYQYSHDDAAEHDVKGPLVDLDTEAAGNALDALIKNGTLPKGDSVASIAWLGKPFNPDPMEYFA